MLVIDFHSHILPGIDDGSRNVEKSLGMLQISASQGVDIIAATSHFYATEDRISSFLDRRQNAFEELKQCLTEKDELGLGAVWLGIASLRDRMDKVREVISIPEELEAFAIIPCGYPIQIKNQQNRYEKERVHFVG